MERHIILRDKKINYSLILKNKKNISMKVDYNGELIVYAPIDISFSYIEEVLKRKEKWIITNIDKLKYNKLSEYNKVFFRGNIFSIKTVLSDYDKIYIDNEVITIKTIKLDNSYIKKLLYNWYIEEANKNIPKRVKELSIKYSLFPSKIIIRNQKSRWGSCNTKREIRLNWRLILMPEFVMDYIIIHELCHLKHMNHSKDFWKLVKNYNSNYNKAEKWLKENGISIMKIN